MSSMFKDARSDWESMKEDFRNYEDGSITRKQLIDGFYNGFSTIETLLSNEVNFDEKPEDEKV